ncbi:unnamed protein product [Caenorhabditis auriculariae]|uniref:Cysteine synthase n=1 Tax=Caenorhabditis auriculariae TaxID=2777116 RepID=A0A8S1H0E4_9PELO|nr:unnamed protein product [Caenorhabditis auriculariae]
MGANARQYLQEHNIPQLFEGLMTGLIYSRPDDPVAYLEEAIARIRNNPHIPVSWNMFIPKSGDEADSDVSREPSRTNTIERRSPEPRLPSVDSTEDMVLQRVPSVTKAAEVARIPNVPVILFMGGPGGGKTRHAAKVANALAENGLVHICMPDVIRNALGRYKDKYPDWKEANEHYMRGELIPNELALILLKAEMGRHPDAGAFFLEGYPREARQVEDFERQEFKQKTLPSAKYFDDQKLLHLIPGEKDDLTIYEKMKNLVLRAIDTGVPVLSSVPPSQSEIPLPEVRTEAPTPQLRQPSFSDAPETVEEIHVPSASFPFITLFKFYCLSIVILASCRGPTFFQSKISRISSVNSCCPNARFSELVDFSLVLGNFLSGSQDRISTTSGNDEPLSPFELPNNAPVVLVVGAPGSQKNDIAKRIAQKYDGFTLLSMGDLLRKKVQTEKDDELWKKVGKKMNEGDPIPMKLARTVLYDEIESLGNANWGYVIEGYPRSMEQLEDFEKSVQRLDIGILIDCTEQFCLDVVQKRIERAHRPDDAPEPLRVRMETFKKNTLPMLKALDDKGKLRVVRYPHDRVDGDSDADTVFKDVAQVIDRALFIEDDGDDRESIGSDATALIGNTPMVYINKLAAGLPGKVAVKLEFMSPAGSVKDRIGYAMVKAAEDEKKIIPGVTTLIEPTSGNTGIALAFVAAARGYRCIVTMPASMSVERRTLLKAYGAEVVLTDPAKGMKGAIERANQLKENIPNSFILAQFDNMNNPAIHYQTTGPEIWRQTKGKVDAVVFGVGTGGTITGVGKFLTEQKPSVQVFAVEPEESAILSGHPAGPHKIQGIGAGFAPGVLDTKIFEDVIRVHSDEAIVMAKRISSGANVVAALQLAARPEMNGKLIVTVLPSFGERYLSSALYTDVRDEAIGLGVEGLDENLKQLKLHEYEHNSQK